MSARGIRLNNPGNVRKGLIWQGMADVQNDPDFITFASPEYGIRAMAKVFMTYKKRYYIDTLSGAVKRYAPPNENDTTSYLIDVCNRTGYNSTEIIDLTDPEVLYKVIPAFIHHEEGCDPYSDAQIKLGVDMATDNQKEDE